MNALLKLTGVHAVTLQSTEEARSQRDHLLHAVQNLPMGIKSGEDAQAIAEMLKEVKNFTRVIEAARTDVKGPVLELGKKIDALAKELTSDLESEATRISKILGAWQAEQNRIAEEARRKAWEEEQRLGREAAERERQAQETARKEQEELQAKAARARTELGRAKAEAEAEVARQRAEEAAKARQDQLIQSVVETRTVAAAAVPTKPSGVATREEIMFEVEDIAALYKAQPTLVKLEPNISAIRAVLKGNPGLSLPGVRSWKEAKTIVR